MNTNDYNDTVKYLKSVYPFADRDWKYSRDLENLTAIRFKDKYDSFPERVMSAFSGLFSRTPNWEKELLGEQYNRSLRHAISFRYYSFIIRIKRRNHLPDGVVSGAGPTYWEESGEYIQLVSPAVGDILVEWLENDPDNPYAVRVVEKMKEIMDDYFERATNS